MKIGNLLIELLVSISITAFNFFLYYVIKLISLKIKDSTAKIHVHFPSGIDLIFFSIIFLVTYLINEIISKRGGLSAMISISSLNLLFCVFIPIVFFASACWLFVTNPEENTITIDNFNLHNLLSNKTFLLGIVSFLIVIFYIFELNI
jgi:hypothetical protein